MCQHINLTMRDGNTVRYGLMDCTPKGGVKQCEITDKSLAHLMASGQFTEIMVMDQQDAAQWQIKTNSPSRVKTFQEKDFPAFIEKVLGSQALQERHHAPEAVGVKVR